jgi:hypothetical protein
VAAKIGLPGLRLKQELSAEGLTGNIIWACGIELARHLARGGAEPIRLRGARVLELGCGTGVVGLAAAALGAHVTLTDLPEALGPVRWAAADTGVTRVSGPGVEAGQLPGMCPRGTGGEGGGGGLACWPGGGGVAAR